MHKRLTLGATLAAAALILTGCAGGTTPGDSAAPSDGSGDALFEVAENVTIEGSPTFDAMKKAGKVTIGVKEDQPGLGYLSAETGERTGFDIEIARWTAATLGFGEDQIEFIAIPSANREAALVNGDIDLYVGTYSITDKRKAQIDFAGPYFITGQGLLVAKDNTTIKSEADLVGTTVCSATGSTPIQNIRDNFPGVNTEEFDLYSQCVEALLDGQVDAVTTDAAILLGFASQNPDELKVVGEPFTVEKYGIGLPLGDDALRGFINDMLADGGSTWQAIFDSTLGLSGSTVAQPEVDRY